MTDIKNKVWILTCNTSRFDVHSKFKEQGWCLWNQRRNFAVGDIIYIYETKPISKIIYKAVVVEINIKRNQPENSDNFYSRDYSKDFCFKMRCVAANYSNRLKYDELYNTFGISGMKLLNMPEISDEAFISFAEDVFAGNVENLPDKPSLEESFIPLEKATMLEHIRHKMDHFKMTNTLLAQQTGISISTIGKARKGESIKVEYVLSMLDALGYAFVEMGNEEQIIPISEITSMIVVKIIGSGMRMTDLALQCNASISVLSHLKNDGVKPKLEVFENLLDFFNFKVVLCEIA